ncbi:MAG: hypothetical protein JWO82_1853, partial [Akkermansiaceae bacterium]|nr:hypothetical protein [Akkermansiaceae bacterium]
MKYLWLPLAFAMPFATTQCK